MRTYMNNFMRYRFLLTELVRKDIKLKYRRSVLGLFWTLLEPLLTTCVLAFVFGTLKSKNDHAFPVYILTGRLMYTYFSNSTKSAMKSIRSNAAMIKKVYVPKYIYPLSAVISNFIIFLLSLIVLVGAMVVLRVKPTIYLLEAVVPLLLLFFMAFGTGMILATVAVFFRDMEYLWGVALMLIMYCSAIFYAPETLGENEWVLHLNPLYCLIENFRMAVYGSPFHMDSLGYAAAVSMFSVAAGVFLFAKQQDKFILNI